MAETERIRTLCDRIRAEIRRHGKSIVSRPDWLALCSNDLVSLGVLAAQENWNYEIVGDSTMRFTLATPVKSPQELRDASLSDPAASIGSNF